MIAFGVVTLLVLALTPDSVISLMAERPGELRITAALIAMFPGIGGGLLARLDARILMTDEYEI